MPIPFYLFVNPNSRLYLSNPFSLSHSILCISACIFVSICCLSTSISLYRFVHPNWRVSLSSLFSLSQPNPYSSTCIYFFSFLSTTISFYLLFNQIYISLFQCPSPNFSLSLVYLPISFSIFMPIQIHGHIFQCSSLCFNISLIYLPLSLSISCIYVC